VGEEGSALAPRSIVRLTAVDGRLELLTPGTPGWNAFVAQVQASEKRWVVLTDPTGAPRLLLDGNRFLRTALAAAEGNIDPRDYGVEPVVTTNPSDTLEAVLTHAKLAESDSPGRGVILLWGEQKRIITHSDVLKRLFEGVITPPTLHARRAAAP
jgi:hypothetical protein